MNNERSLHKPLLGIADLGHANEQFRFVRDRHVLEIGRKAVVCRFNPRPWDHDRGGCGGGSRGDVLVTLPTSMYGEADEHREEDRDDEDYASQQRHVDHQSHVRRRRPSLLFFVLRLDLRWLVIRQHDRRRRRSRGRPLSESVFWRARLDPRLVNGGSWNRLKMAATGGCGRYVENWTVHLYSGQFHRVFSFSVWSFHEYHLVDVAASTVWWRHAVARSKLGDIGWRHGWNCWRLPVVTTANQCHSSVIGLTASTSWQDNGLTVQSWLKWSQIHADIHIKDSAFAIFPPSTATSAPETPVAQKLPNVSWIL